MNHKGLNQLLCAAVVNNNFRETLLRNPAQAIATGYLGHSFSLTPDERDFVVDIKAQKFEDFAGQIHNWLSGSRRNGTSSAEPFTELFPTRVPVRA